MTIDLSDLATKHGTDKNPTLHNYCDRYEDVLPRRWDKVTLCEIGILNGASIAMWAEWFTHPETKIVGVDIDPGAIARAKGYLESCGLFDSRIELISANATTEVFAGLVYLHSPFNVIIDDGSHMCEDQILALRHGWSLLGEGGLWIVEDIHVGCHPQFNDHNGGNILDFIGMTARDMQFDGDGLGDFYKSAKYNTGKSEFIRSLYRMTVSKSMLILEKRLA